MELLACPALPSPTLPLELLFCDPLPFPPSPLKLSDCPIIFPDLSFLDLLVSQSTIVTTPVFAYGCLLPNLKEDCARDSASTSAVTNKPFPKLVTATKAARDIVRILVTFMFSTNSIPLGVLIIAKHLFE